ncbi:hypothetical protein BJY04DRAFT_214376 [Aspergillus karnatakaensis]|uniref:uncharacterized protein n=1 Tax=Aspergillus karnatakaensis TaxID=1810916 RepID=UPI003CCD1739
MLIPFLLARQISGYIPPENPDQPDDQDSSKNKTTQIIIGTVVGGVAAIAITAAIIFFFVKKRKWDRIRKCEERLIDYQLATGYSSKQQSRSVTPEDYANMMASPPATSTTTTTMYPYPPGNIRPSVDGHKPGSRARGMSAPASTTLAMSTSTPGTGTMTQGQGQGQGQGPSPEAPPPAYQTLHPRYDPSRYSQISTRFSSSFEFPRSSSSTVTGSGSGSGTRAFGMVSAAAAAASTIPAVSACAGGVWAWQELSAIIVEDDVDNHYDHITIGQYFFEGITI